MRFFLIGLLLAGLSTNVLGSSDTFLRLEGIEGVTESEEYAGQMEILSFGQGLRGTPNGNYFDGPFIDDFTFITKAARHSDDFLQHLLTGRPIPNGTLSIVRAGGTPIEVWEFEDLLLTSFSHAGGDGSEIVNESFSLRPARFELSTFEQDENGKPIFGGSFGWDTVRNVAWSKGTKRAASVPEPSASWLASSFLLLGSLRSRRRKRTAGN